MTDLVVKLIRFVLLVAGIAVLVLLGLAVGTGADWAQYGPLLAALVGLACGALLLQIADRLRDLAEAQAQTNELLLAQGRARSRPTEEPGLRAEPRPGLRAEARGGAASEPRGEERSGATRREPVLQRKD